MKLKSVLIALLMIIGTTLMAQEKYEQAVVMQVSSLTNLICVYEEGKEMRKEKVKSELNDFTPLLKQLALMRDQGWEVWNSGIYTNGFVYFLRRKLK